MKRTQKSEGILLVSFGSTDEKAMKNTVFALEEFICQEFPSFFVLSAITGDRVRKIWKERRAACLPDLEDALHMMYKRGMDKVYVLPTFLGQGMQYEKMQKALFRWKKQFVLLDCAKPLLAGDKACTLTAKCLIEESGIGQDETLILMGHGRKSSVPLEYHGLWRALEKLFPCHTVIEFLQDERGLENAARKAWGLGREKLCLMPLLFLAGYHVRTEMAGKENSWKSFLEDKGFLVRIKARGLGEMIGIRKILKANLCEIIEKRNG